MGEETALVKLRRDKEELELQAHHFVAQLAQTWEDPFGLPELLTAADEVFAGWVRSQAADLSALLGMVHQLRAVLSALEQAETRRRGGSRATTPPLAARAGAPAT